MRHRVNSTLPGSKDLSLTQPAGVEVFLRRNLLRQFLGQMQMQEIGDSTRPLHRAVYISYYAYLCDFMCRPLD